jgi:hypothetical protein
VERRAQASKSFANACGSRQAADSTASLLWYSAAQHALHSTGNGSAGPGQGGVGWPGSRKTFKSSRPLPLPARTPPCARSLPQGPSTRAHRQPSSSSPLAAQHSAAVALVPDSLLLPVGAFGFLLLPSSHCFFTSSSTRSPSPAASSTSSTSQRDPSCFSFLLAWTWLFDYHSLIDIDNPDTHFETSKNNRAPTDS